MTCARRSEAGVSTNRVARAVPRGRRANICWHGQARRRAAGLNAPSGRRPQDRRGKHCGSGVSCSWAGADAKYLSWPRAHCCSPRPAAPRRYQSRIRTTRQIYCGAE